MFLFYVLSFFKKGDTIKGGTLFKEIRYTFDLWEKLFTRYNKWKMDICSYGKFSRISWRKFFTISYNFSLFIFYFSMKTNSLNFHFWFNFYFGSLCRSKCPQNSIGSLYSEPPQLESHHLHHNFSAQTIWTHMTLWVSRPKYRLYYFMTMWVREHLIFAKQAVWVLKSKIFGQKLM